MARGKAKQPSLRDYGRIFNCSHELIRIIKDEGVNLSDTEAVIARLTQNPNYVPPGPTAPAGKPVANSTEGQQGLRAAIERLRECELAASDNYRKALADNSPAAGNALKNWTAIIEQLRKAEESTPDIEKANSNSVSKDELAQSLGGLFKDLRQDLDALPNKIATQGQNCSKEALQQIVKQHAERIIDSLHNWKGAGNG